MEADQELWGGRYGRHDPAALSGEQRIRASGAQPKHSRTVGRRSYAEEQLKHSNRWFDFELNAGVRFTQMFNLDTKYTELRKLQVEPRINAALSFNIDLAGGKSLRNMFRFGFGQENKLPTLDYIYRTGSTKI